MAENNAAIPAGDVTFLFSDVVGSTRIWAADPDGMSKSLRIHDAILRAAIESRSGYIFTTAGDSFAAAFEQSEAAIAAAIEAQASLAAADWDDGPQLTVRIGIHAGAAEQRDGDYFGPTVNATARLEAAGHGGQVLISEAVRVAAAGIAATDLGDHRLRDIETPMRIHQVGDSAFPPLRGVGTVNLPLPRTALFGRDEAVATVRRLLASHQLVTLTGVGGCGKTRLALEVAHREVPDCPGGVWFVDLAPVAESAAVPGAFAVALGITTDPFSSAADQIAMYLGARAGLLVVDNCEHVVDAVAGLLDVVMDRCAALRIVATSREPLSIAGEVPWRVPSLDLGPDSTAVDLFVDRAANAADGFDPDSATRSIVAEICARLDGIPLAIELAAARTRSMSATEIRDRLDDRFRLLSGGARRSGHRQATLEAAVQWSYDLLDAGEQEMLRRLSVFQGGFDLADVADVAGVGDDEAVDVVDALVAKSLVDVRRDHRDRVRHRLLETIRLFALARLVDAGEATATRDRHLEHFDADPPVLDWGIWQTVDAHRRIDRELDNLRAAATWAIECARPEAAARIGATVHDALLERGEAGVALTWLQPSAALDPAAQVRMLAATAYLRVNTFDVAGAEVAARSAIAAAAGRPLDPLPLAHLLLSQVHMMRGEVVDALDENRRALEIALTTPSPDLNAAYGLLYRCLFRGMAGEFGPAIADADTVIRRAPEFVYRSLVEALRALAMQLSGCHDDASRAVGEFSEPSPSSPWVHANDIVATIVASTEVGPEAAARRLAALAADAVPRRPMAVGDWLAGFAYLATERGDDERAREIITTTLAPVLVPLDVEVLSRVFEWPLGGRFDGYLRYLTDNPADERVGRALEHQPRLFAAELAHWS